MKNFTIQLEHDVDSNRDYFVARDEEGEEANRVEAWEAITARSDSHEIANAVISHLPIVSVDHDGELIHVACKSDKSEWCE